MAGLSIRDARKSFGDVNVLNGISIDAAPGDFVVIVGPSGCGKSTLLRTIAGLESLSSGSIHIGDRDVTTSQPSERGIAMVFQSYALYPHLTVYENMAFALRVARTEAAAVDAAVHQAAETLDITHLLNRKPAALSGGQRQRVAIGRAIVRKPQLFLFDEPLSNLDADLRGRMRYEFAQLHRTLATTTIYVTHDQVEAMTLADKIVMLRDGRVEQVGTPQELYEHPANSFVAQFLGTPRMNLVNGVVGEGDRVIFADGQSAGLPNLAQRLPSGARVSLGVRPDNIVPGGGNTDLTLKVAFVERLGGMATVHFHGIEDGEIITCLRRDDGAIRDGDIVPLSIEISKAHVFDSDGAAIAKAVNYQPCTAAM